MAERSTADAIVPNRQREGSGVRLDLDLHGRRMSMLGNVRQRLRDHVVGCDLDLVGKLNVDARVEVDRRGGAARQRSESSCKPTVGENRWMDPAGDLPEAVEDGGEVLRHSG